MFRNEAQLDIFQTCDQVLIFGHDLPVCQPDDLLKSGAYLVFGPSLIFIVFVLAATIKSWVDLGRLSLRGTYSALHSLRGAGVAVRQRSNGNVLVAAALVALVIIIQLTWVFISYYVGNSVRLFVEGIAGTLDAPPGLDARDIPSLLKSGPYTAWAMGLCAVAAAMSWLLRRATNGGSPTCWSSGCPECCTSGHASRT